MYQNDTVGYNDFDFSLQNEVSPTGKWDFKTKV
jgi:hypothetical protein